MNPDRGKKLYSVSVVIPAYNVEKYIARAIDSVLAQSHLPDEIIVVDDGSTDNTAGVIARYGGQVRYIHQENAGGSAARNTGIEAAKSEWIAFLDADDEWLPEKLKLQIEHLKRNPHIQWAYTNFFTCSATDNQRKLTYDHIKYAPLMKDKEYFEDYLEAYLNIGHLLTTSTIIKRRVLYEAGLFRAEQMWAQDADMFLRVAYLYPQIGFIAEPLAVYYSNMPGSITIKNKYRIKQRCDLIERHMELSARHNRRRQFELCAQKLLKDWMRGTIRDNRFADISEMIDRFDDLLPKGLKTEMRLRMRFPYLAPFCFRLYFGSKRFLRSVMGK